MEPAPVEETDLRVRPVEEAGLKSDRGWDVLPPIPFFPVLPPAHTETTIGISIHVIETVMSSSIINQHVIETVMSSSIINQRRFQPAISINQQ
jgi:hypothetical protein